MTKPNLIQIKKELGTCTAGMKSALDQKRTFRYVRSMSALPPKADIAKNIGTVTLAVCKDQAYRAKALTSKRRPEQLGKRTLAVRGFDASGMMTGWEIVEGTNVEAAIERQFANVEASQRGRSRTRAQSCAAEFLPTRPSVSLRLPK
jgi:uncharacterized protein DUF1203